LGISLSCVIICGCRRQPPQSSRFYALSKEAKENFAAGRIEQARKDAGELLQLLPRFQGDWNYGNAVHDANFVLGRIAVKEGRIDEAKKYLIAAGKSPGSPQLNSFGPNMSLANDLLQKGQKDVVLEYFELCRGFWRMDRGRLNQWSQDVKAGIAPSFGPNLLY
jgi:tetratricopeptide (TPR) repeat protein